jgi:alpha-glucuronidase
VEGVPSEWASTSPQWYAVRRGYTSNVIYDSWEDCSRQVSSHVEEIISACIGIAGVVDDNHENWQWRLALLNSLYLALTSKGARLPESPVQELLV